MGGNRGLERIQDFIGLADAQGLERRSHVPPTRTAEGPAIPFLMAEHLPNFIFGTIYRSKSGRTDASAPAIKSYAPVSPDIQTSTRSSAHSTRTGAPPFDP
jgi:hypothetical protein